MTNENLQITSEELLALYGENPLEIGVILEMLAEAGEDCHIEMEQLEQPRKAA